MGKYHLASSYTLGIKKDKKHIKAEYIVLLFYTKSVPNSSYKFLFIYRDIVCINLKSLFPIGHK